MLARMKTGAEAHVENKAPGVGARRVGRRGGDKLEGRFRDGTVREESTSDEL